MPTVLGWFHVEPVGNSYQRTDSMVQMIGDQGLFSGLQEAAPESMSSGLDGPSTVIVVLTGRRFSVGLDRVRIIAEAGPVTPLPWSRSPVEGLARVKGRPVVQVRGGSPGGEGHGRTAGGWLVVLGTHESRDEIALRVDEVIGLAYDGMPPAEPLPLSGVWPNFGYGGEAAAEAVAGADESVGDGADGDAAALDVLLLRFQGERLALLLDQVRCVASLEAVDTVTLLGGGRQRLARVDGRLLPAVVLSERFGAGPMIGHWAVVGVAARHEDVGPEVALLLPEGAAFDRIALGALDGLPSVPGALAWWRSGAAEPPVGLYDFATVIGTPGEPPALNLPPVPGSGRRKSDAGHVPGLVRLMCGGLACAVPLAVVGNALDRDETPGSDLVSRRLEVPGVARGVGPGAIPVLDGRRLLTGGGDGRSGLWLRLETPGGPGLVLVIDRLEPEGAGADYDWQAPPRLPAGPAALIEAVRWDEATQTWVLRLHSELNFRTLPMIAKKATVAALIGWLPIPSRSLIGRPEDA